jgi:hypothetical protein
MTNTIEITKTPVLIDARGPRWSALLTVIVLSVALVTSNVWVATFQAAVFAIGALRGPQFTPYALFFKRVIKPQLKSATAFEDVRPPQFAQSVGLIFAVVAVIGSITGIGAIFTVAIAFALAAAFLNAAFNFCLGCEMYLLILRARSSK